MRESIPSPPTRFPEYRGRFAPSPTGPLHLGSLYTALAGFLQARSRGGAWFLRIDDLDPPRTVPGAADRIQRGLEALGLHWDGSVLYQSQRLAAYAAALDRLREAGWVYACACSRKQLAAHAAGVYPGWCRARIGQPPPAAHALRVRVQGGTLAFDDALQGRIAQHLETEVGDFILYRRDAVYAYPLATVLDDAAQGITEVLRGIDLMDSTPRQIHLERLLGLPAKTYAHVPVLVDAHTGQKLSKQNLAPAADTAEPGRLLFHLLGLLKQTPPAELAGAAAAEILAWAVENWEARRLAGIESIAVDARRFQP